MEYIVNNSENITYMNDEYMKFEFEYKCYSNLFLKLLKIDLDNSFEKYRIIDNTKNLTCENLKLISKIKYLIIEKTNDFKFLFDDSIVESLICLISLYNKYNLSERENEKSELIDVIQFELTYLVPKFLIYFDSIDLDRIYASLVEIMDTTNSNLRFSIKYIFKQFRTKKLIRFDKDTNDKENEKENYRHDGYDGHDRVFSKENSFEIKDNKDNKENQEHKVRKESKEENSFEYDKFHSS